MRRLCHWQDAGETSWEYSKPHPLKPTSGTRLPSPPLLACLPLQVNDATKEKNDSHAGKVVERHWYERNKHVFPATRWEVGVRWGWLLTRLHSAAGWAGLHLPSSPPVSYPCPFSVLQMYDPEKTYDSYSTHDW